MVPCATITPEEAAEVQRLRRIYHEESFWAAEAMRTGGEPLEGEALRRVLDHDRKAGEALLRIHEIYGD
jgi:hypothetical protein